MFPWQVLLPQAVCKGDLSLPFQPQLSSSLSASFHPLDFFQDLYDLELSGCG
jgi:hypothetical protein